MFLGWGGGACSQSPLVGTMHCDPSDHITNFPPDNFFLFSCLSLASSSLHTVSIHFIIQIFFSMWGVPSCLVCECSQFTLAVTALPCWSEMTGLDGFHQIIWEIIASMNWASISQYDCDVTMRQNPKNKHNSFYGLFQDNCHKLWIICQVVCNVHHTTIDCTNDMSVNFLFVNFVVNISHVSLEYILHFGRISRRRNSIIVNAHSYIYWLKCIQAWCWLCWGSCHFTIHAFQFVWYSKMKTLNLGHNLLLNDIYQIRCLHIFLKQYGINLFCPLVPVV